MKKLDIKTMINVMIITALYVALTLLLAPLSYNAIQFRLSEALIILVCYNPIYAISLSLGCLIANFASPMATMDIIFGTMATIIAVIPMFFIKNKPIASLFPSIVNAIIIGIELHSFYELPFWLSAFQVFIGEFVVVTVIGLPLFKSVEKNNFIVNGLQLRNINQKETKLDKVFKPEYMINFALLVIGVILFFYLGIYTEFGSDINMTYTLFNYAIKADGVVHLPILIIHLIVPVLVLLVCLFKNHMIKLVLKITLGVLGIIFLIVALAKTEQKANFYFYFYFLYYIAIVFIGFITFKLRNNNYYEVTE